jgi:nucleotidyltransferase/DNA polymerase involved in DNA repair
MPILDLDAKIEFNVDQMTIDRVEALAAIEGLDLNAWFRRLVDELIAQGSRHMGIDHVEVEEVRKPVLDIIKKISDSLHPLRQKARELIDKLSVALTFKKAEDEASVEVEIEEKESVKDKVVKKIRGTKGKKIKKPEPEPEVIEPEAPPQPEEPELEIEAKIEPEEALEIIEEALEDAEEEDAEKTAEIERLKKAISDLEES